VAASSNSSSLWEACWRKVGPNLRGHTGVVRERGVWAGRRLPHDGPLPIPPALRLREQTETSLTLMWRLGRHSIPCTRRDALVWLLRLLETARGYALHMHRGAMTQQSGLSGRGLPSRVVPMSTSCRADVHSCMRMSDDSLTLLLSARRGVKEVCRADGHRRARTV